MYISNERLEKLTSFATKFSLNFSSLQNLNSAFIHSSYLNFDKSAISYERLEFLGDAVLKFIVSSYFFNKFPDFQEGKLTEVRNSVVSDASLAIFASKVDYTDLILFSPDVNINQINLNSVNACVFEAILGAIYLDLGVDNCYKFLIDNFEDEIITLAKDAHCTNYRAILQDYTQKNNGTLPVYNLVNEFGEPHDKTFTYQVLWNNRILGEASAKTKKNAQMLSAKVAVEYLKSKEVL